MKTKKSTSVANILKDINYAIYSISQEGFLTPKDTWSPRIKEAKLLNLFDASVIARTERDTLPVFMDRR